MRARDARPPMDLSGRPTCGCEELDVLEGPEAIAYAGQHLQLVAVAADAMSAGYRCPLTGHDWREEYRIVWLTGESPTRLVRARTGPSDLAAERGATSRRLPRGAMPRRAAGALAGFALLAVVAGTCT